MAETTPLFLAMSLWIRTTLVVVLLLIVLIQFVRLTPPFRKQGDALSDLGQAGRFLGRTGRALTPLRPVGMCEFENQRVECVAENGYVEKGASVEMVRVEGMQPTVRTAKQA